MASVVNDLALQFNLTVAIRMSCRMLLKQVWYNNNNIVDRNNIRSKNDNGRKVMNSINVADVDNIDTNDAINLRKSGMIINAKTKAS